MTTMSFVFLVTLISSILAVVAANPAPLSKDNPRNIVAVADFPESGTNKFTKGYVYFTSPKGDSVKVHVDMTGLPTSGGPFIYHIHEGQIFDKVSCDEAGKHFDPFKGHAKCPEKGDDALCMVGDLSGKHGWINATCFQTEYHDKFLSLNPASESYIVGRSLVFHDQKSTRFACANINLASAEQYKDLFGAPGKTSGSHSAESDTSATHSSGTPKQPSQQPPQAAPAPDPALNPVPKTPTRPAEPQPVSSPANISEAPSATKTATQVSSTAGTKEVPTGFTNAGKADAGNKFVHRSTDSPSPGVLISSNASSLSFLRRLIGTVLGVLLGIFF